MNLQIIETHIYLNGTRPATFEIEPECGSPLQCNRKVTLSSFRKIEVYKIGKAGYQLNSGKLVKINLTEEITSGKGKDLRPPVIAYGDEIVDLPGSHLPGILITTYKGKIFVGVNHGRLQGGDPCMFAVGLNGLKRRLSVQHLNNKQLIFKLEHRYADYRGPREDRKYWRYGTLIERRHQERRLGKPYLEGGE